MSASSYFVRRAVVGDESAVRLLHDSSLEVKYDASFFSSFFDARSDVLCLVIEEVARASSGSDGGGGEGEDGGGGAAGEWEVAQAQPAQSPPQTTPFLDELPSRSTTIVGVLSARVKEREGVGTDSAGTCNARAASAGVATIGLTLWGPLSGAAKVLSAALSLSAPPPPCAYIMTLCVDVRARRRGIGRALLAALTTEIAAGALTTGGLPLVMIELHVLASNVAAVSLYTNAGFATLCTVPRYYCLGGEYPDALLMAATCSGGGGVGAADFYSTTDTAAAIVEPATWRAFFEWIAYTLGIGEVKGLKILQTAGNNETGGGGGRSYIDAIA